MTTIENTTQDTKEIKNFIEEIIDEHNLAGRFGGIVHTRFPPEPNGYLHIGHAKSICLNFGLAQKYGGITNLRFDDTNPSTEDEEYVNSIMADVRWLGFDWADRLYYASDFFEQLYAYAIQLIEAGKAYVDDQTAEEISANRGTPAVPSTPSPYRDRTVAENLDLFTRMKNGDFEEGEKVLRAKIDLASPNMWLRDPVMYRIKKATHHQTGDKWCIYPMYDWAHGLCDSLEGITHSICTLEFEVHRPLYDWFIDQLGVHHPQQIEFARLNLTYTVMSKRKLLQLVNENIVEGWSDPRMPTISGLRRRGYTPESIRNFAARIGVAKRDNLIDVALLEFSVREHLNKTANRVMAVLKPLKVVISNYPEGQTEELTAINNPEDESAGSRVLPFGKELYIEQDDFMEDAPKKYFRLMPGGIVRLKYAYIIECEEVIKNAEGEITELLCKYFPLSKSGEDTSGLKPKATIHWVSAKHALAAEVRLYDRLFTVEEPDGDKDKDFKTFLNPESLQTLANCRVEPSLQTAQAGDRFQFERLGYFCVDSEDATPEKLVFNRTVALKDTWAKEKDK
jgi:glutaminyl-tRNA synthetase